MLRDECVRHHKSRSNIIIIKPSAELTHSTKQREKKINTNKWMMNSQHRIRIVEHTNEKQILSDNENGHADPDIQYSDVVWCRTMSNDAIGRTIQHENSKFGLIDESNVGLCIPCDGKLQRNPCCVCVFWHQVYTNWIVRMIGSAPLMH